ncbi:MAG: hypothetical protein HY916_00005 [Desulfovibrio sp.]|jgi:hypothetical protein|nr:hypothetical protein [Desulfovibrio sp.]
MKRSAPFFRLLPGLLCALVLLLSGCWVPERYLARIKIERDGSYRVAVEGTAVHHDTWLAVKRLQAEIKAGKLKPEEIKKAQAEVLAPLFKDLEALKGDRRVESVSSIGDGRVRFSLIGTWQIDRKLLIASEFTVPIDYAVGQDGSMRLRVKDAVETAEARSLGIVTEGTLSVSVAEGVEVLEHNARKAPSSPYGSYRWEIGPGSTTPPYLKIRLPEAAPPQGNAQPQKGLARH